LFLLRVVASISVVAIVSKDKKIAYRKRKRRTPEQQ